MDQETAQILFNKGAFLLFLDAPTGLEFGIDYNSWQTGPRFKGVKLIPPGLHFVYYSTSDKSGISGLRNGFFKFYESKEVVIKYWDPNIEDIKRDDETVPEQNERLKSDMRQFDSFLGVYPLTPPTDWKKWINLTNYITPSLISRILPNEGRMNNVSSSTVDEDELLNIKGSSKFYEDIILFTKFDLKKSWRPGAVGQEITKYSLDKSWLLCELLTSVYKNDYKELLGELQLSFVCLLIGQNFAGFTQWKNLVQLICMCKEAINTYNMTLFSEFVDVINFQLEECPADFFRDIISQDNFLSHVLKVILVLICTLSHLQSTLSVQFARTVQRNLLCCI
ncbi:AAR2-domain-containing protein [Gigaspora margarita]|uniref:AAR2-domain-containing protein n=1 Tax=Gigaspora margarita TaxID=4874 RepID=A0A8H4A9B4_GIGMA|nr:AAR2-domain-containing protein [Gigaspora margarita]